MSRPKPRHGIDRREFLQASTGALAAGWGLSHGASRASAQSAADALQAAAARVGKLPRRALGSSKRKISVMVGASDWEPEAIEAGLRCGVNYWHKAQRFRLNAEPGTRYRTTPAQIIKEREAHYCELVVDRVRGNHETGVIDEEEHYRFAKEAIEQSGLRYYDDLIFHFGYHNVAEYKAERGFLRLFERLKREGLVKHLGLTQHNYNGNAKVPDGESAAQILTVIMADGLYEHAQLFYSYGDGAEVDEFLSAAQKRGLGTIAMKTGRGLGRMEKEADFMKTLPPGVSPYHALVRWLTTATPLTATVLRVRNLDEFADSLSGAGKPLRAADRLTLDRSLAYVESHACRLCNVCLGSCPQRLPIADILRYERYALDNGDYEEARQLYAALDVSAGRCDDCNQCLARCPQRLRIPEKLRATHRLLAS